MTKTTKIILGLVVLAVVVILVVVFYKPSPKETIKIGAILPLTGSMSYIGEEIKNGISMAMEDINSKNKIKIEPIFEDSKMDPKEGVSAVNKLIDVDKIKYIHVFGTPVISAVRPITESKAVILTGVSIAPTILQNANYTLRIFYNLDQALERFTEFIEKENHTKIAILYQNGEAWERQVMSLEQQGLSFIKKEKFDMGEKDFRTRLLKIKESNPDLIIVIGYGSHFPSIFQQMEELGMQNITVFGGLDFLEVPKETVNLYENAVFIVPSFNIEPAKKSSNFIEEYERKFVNKPTHQTAYAYDTIQLLYTAITKTDGSPEQVIAYLKEVGTYDGVVGQIEFFPDGNTKSTLSFATYKNGSVVPYK
jgi:branched-chain amino acid transport system substrate-binding protein